jgi:D-amino-acid dehydrogenase
MRIAVIGAGLTGVTTAFELARDGHEVTVFERRGGVAAGGSFAPVSVGATGLWLAAAAVASGDAGTWATPTRTTALAWRYRTWRASRRPGASARLALMTELSRQGLARLEAASEAHQLEFERHAGVTALLRHPRHARRAEALLVAHAEQAIPVRWLDAHEARQVEPALPTDLAFQGALHWPAGQTANGRQFAQKLKSVAQGFGARFLFQCEVTSLTPGAKGVEVRVVRSEFGESVLPQDAGSIGAEAEPVACFDASVVCSATASADLLGRPGGSPRVRPISIHSITAPIREPNDAATIFAPRGAVLMPADGITIGRMGDRLRAAGCAADGRLPQRPEDKPLGSLHRALEACFPGAARTARAQAWVGRQSSTADGLPVVGMAQPAIWLHWGHGSNRWAWAPATARLLADQLSDRPLSVDSALLAPTRLG